MKKMKLNILIYLLTLSMVGTWSLDAPLYSEEELLRLQHQAIQALDAQSETINGYKTDLLHRDPETNQEHSVSSVAVEFHLKDPNPDQLKNVNNERTKSRSDNKRKVVRIKNPFQNHLNEDDREESDVYEQLDSKTGGSNQYAAMQYSLPPEDFLKHMREESFLQQLSSTIQPLSQISSTSPPQYQFNYNNNNPEIQQLISSTISPLQQQYDQNYFQYQSLAKSALPQQYSYNQQNTVPSQYANILSENQYTATPMPDANYLSSPSSQSLHLSTPDSNSQQNHPLEFGSRLNPLHQYESNQLQIDHYNNALSGVRFPFQGNDFQTSTTSPASSSNFPEVLQEALKLAAESHNDVKKFVSDNSFEQNFKSEFSNFNQPGEQIAKSAFLNAESPRSIDNYHYRHHVRDLEQESSQPAYSYGDYGWKLNDNKQNSFESSHGQKIGSTTMTPEVMSQNSFHSYRKKTYPLQNQYDDNMYKVNHVKQPSNKPYQNINVGYSLDFGTHPSLINQPQNNNVNSDMSKNYNHLSNSNQNVLSDSLQAQDFVNSALKMQNKFKQLDLHEDLNKNSDMYSMDNSNSKNADQKLMYSHYAPNYVGLNFAASHPENSNFKVESNFYGSSNQNNQAKRQKDKKFNNFDNLSINQLINKNNGYKLYGGLENNTPNPYIYGYPQNDIITSIPYYSANDMKQNQQFDHEKALKNIQPIDFTDVIQTPNPLEFDKSIGAYQNSGKMNNLHAQQLIHNEPQNNILDIKQSLKHIFDAYKPLSNTYYKDKNVGYGLHIKPKPENLISNFEGLKMSENPHYFNSQKNIPFQSLINQWNQENKNQAFAKEALKHIQQASNNHQVHVHAPSGYKINDPVQRYKLTRDSTHSAILSPQDNFNLQNQLALLPQNSFELQQQLTAGKINQNMGIHNLEAQSNLLNKLGHLNSNRNSLNNYNRLNELDPQSFVTTINGIKVANPFNVDLKLVADMLKGKSSIDETRLIPIRDQLQKIVPTHVDSLSYHQILSKSENNYPEIDFGEKDLAKYDSMQEENNLFKNMYKYSRSQTEDALASTDGTNNHPIGAVVDQTETQSFTDNDTPTDIMYDGENMNNNGNQNIPQPFILRDQQDSSSNHHPNSLFLSHAHSLNKNSKGMLEPYPLLKPPRPPRRNAFLSKNEKRSRFNRPGKNQVRPKSSSYAEDGNLMEFEEHI